MRTTGDQQLLKRINRSVLLRLLRAQPGLSRARLSQQSGLTKSTVSALVRELLDENWLNEASAPVAADGMGRPSTPLRLNTDIRVLIGVEIAVEFLRIVCVSLTGVVISRAEVPLESTQPDRVCKQTTRMVSGLCRELQDDKLVLSGVGVCLPGAINDDSGIVRFAPNLGWRGVKFLEMIHHQRGGGSLDIHQLRCRRGRRHCAE
jgi:predicted transcriptional regulator